MVNFQPEADPPLVDTTGTKYIITIAFDLKLDNCCPIC